MKLYCFARFYFDKANDRLAYKFKWFKKKDNLHDEGYNLLRLRLWVYWYVIYRLVKAQPSNEMGVGFLTIAKSVSFECKPFKIYDYI